MLLYSKCCSKDLSLIQNDILDTHSTCYKNILIFIHRSHLQLIVYAGNL